MVKKEWVWMYFNDEWNEPTTNNDEGDDESTYVDGIDERPITVPKEYNDDEYDY
jgi:hypothetical protein